VDTRLSVTTETVGIESSAVVGGRAAGHSMVMAVEEEAAVNAATAATRTTGKVVKVDTSGTTTVRVATISTRMVTTRRAVRAVDIADEEAWTDHQDLTVVEWIEEARGEVRGVIHEVVEDTEEVKLVVKAYQLAVLGLSSSYSKHTRHDRLTSQPP